jgi:predicted RND superfamily exporter protein
VTPRSEQRARRFVRWAIERRRAIWLVVALIALPALVRVVGLYAHLKSEIAELLPSDAPSVQALEALDRRMPGLSYLGVVVDVGRADQLARGERLVDDLAARVRAYPPSLVRGVRTGTQAERDFVERHAALYANLEDLREIKERIETRRDWEVSKAQGIDFDLGPEPSLDFSDLEQRTKARVGGAGQGVGRFSSPELHTTVLLIQAVRDGGAAHNRELLGRVQRDLIALGGPAAYGPGLRVGYAGDVAISVEEQSALETDLGISSVLVIVAVLAVLWGFFRWWGSIPILLIPLAAATITTFGLVTLPPLSITALNSNTAFLGSVVIGNGINFGIILLARYAEERRRGAAIEDALVTSIVSTRLATIVAAAAAATAYGSLILTRFRGFHQFGVIGGIGMLLCWGAAFLLVPSLVTLFDRTPDRWRPAPSTGLMPRIARLVVDHPVPVVVFALVTSVASVMLAKNIDRDSIEYDFSKLRRSDTTVIGEGYWGRKMDAVLQRYLTPIVVLGDDPSQARKIAASIDAQLHGERARDAVDLGSVIASVHTANDVVPKDQPAKLAEARAIRALMTPRIRASVPESGRKWLARLDAMDLAPITLADVPAGLLTGFREFDGRVDRTALVSPRPSRATWQGDTLVGVTGELRRIAADYPSANGHVAPIAGSLPLSADIITSIEHDAPIAVGAALLGVMILVLAVFRATTAGALVLGSLLVGVLWLTGTTEAMHAKINFCNFIAFPITFGIGVDYSVNVMCRYVSDEDLGAVVRDRIERAISLTGGAVGLCSLTTIIGYGSLLVAKNRALFSFGLLSVIGEIACLFTAVVVLPAVLVVFEGRRRVSGEQGSSARGIPLHSRR